MGNNFYSCFTLYRKFSLFTHPKKLTCWHFTLNRKSFYLGLIYGKKIITPKPVHSGHAMQRDTWLLQILFRNHRCPLGTSLTLSSILIFNISQKFSNYLQILGYFIHIIIFRQVDNKSFNFIMKFMVHDTNFFNTFLFDLLQLHD